MEMARSMLATKHLSNEYWVEAVATTIYIMNKCLKKSLKNIVPQEAWTRMKHNVSYLNFFGCVTYAHVSDEMRKKLDNKGNKCIFIGYFEDTKEYKLYDPVARKVIISRDVQFMENEAHDGSIANIVIIIDAIEHDDTKEEVNQIPCTIQYAVPSISSTATQITTHNTLVRIAGA
jgi:hypothetical protein